MKTLRRQFALARLQRGFISMLQPYQFGAGAPPPATTTWNSADKDADITLSGGDLTATIVNALGIVRGTASRDGATANRYFELTNKNASTNIGFRVGLANSSASLTGSLGSDIDGWGMSSGTKYNNGSSNSYDATNCIIGVKLDLDAGTVSFVRAGVDIGTAYSSLSGTFYPAWGPGTSGAGTRAAVLNTGGSTFVYGLPSGYTAWGGTWNSADKDADITLSGGDLTATVVTALGMVRGTQGRSSGKYYFEVEIQGADRNHLVGVAKSTATLASYPGSDANGWAYFALSRQRYNNNSGVSYKADEVWGVALNSGSVSVIVDGYNRGTMYSGITGNVFPAWGSDTSSGTYVGALNCGQSAFVYGLPPGLSAWG